MVFEHHDNGCEGLGVVVGVAWPNFMEQVLAYEQWEDVTELSVSDSRESNFAGGQLTL